MKEYFVAIPDNERQFYAYINMIVNNRGNAHLPQRLDQVPKKVGPVPVTLTTNEVGEPYFIVGSNKDYCFVEMVKDQFCLLRSHWNMISTFEQYPNASKYWAMVIMGTPVERRADLDIAIFKFVRKDLTAYYYDNFKYKLGEVHYSTLGMPWPVIGLRGASSIGSGFHSFGINCLVQNNPETVTIYSPFHTRYTIGCFRKDDLCKVEGIIPKGSLYYKNSDEEYVSSHIIIKRITKVYEKTRVSNCRWWQCFYPGRW